MESGRSLGLAIRSNHSRIPLGCGHIETPTPRKSLSIKSSTGSFPVSLGLGLALTEDLFGTVAHRRTKEKMKEREEKEAEA